MSYVVMCFCSTAAAFYVRGISLLALTLGTLDKVVTDSTQNSTIALDITRYPAVLFGPASAGKT